MSGESPEEIRKQMKAKAAPVAIIYSSDPAQSHYALKEFERLMSEGCRQKSLEDGFGKDGGVEQALLENVDGKYLVGGHFAFMFPQEKKGVAM